MTDITDKIAVIDFGGQYTQLIARRVRELGVYSRIFACDKVTVDDLAEYKGIVLSGGPKGCIGQDAPKYNRAVLEMDKPYLDICYGMQLRAHVNGGKVVHSEDREYGNIEVTVDTKDKLFTGLEKILDVRMSHGDTVQRVPRGYRVIARTENNLVAAMSNPEKRVYSVQFHPEVTHTQKGMDILRNFTYRIAGCKKSWGLGNYIDQTMDYIDKTVRGRDVIMFLSGGVDSTVAATLLARAKQLGKNVGNLYLYHIDNGLMRTNESQQVVEDLKKIPGLEKVVLYNASKQFLHRLRGVVDPEKKRKIIGDTFIDAQKQIMKHLKLGKNTMLGQGTLYTDLIESGKGVGRKAAKIKTHHNVGSPLVKKMAQKGLLVEPNREIFKDEVRELGEILGLPEEIVWRQPFPGPGLAIRIVGQAVTPERLAILRKADDIFLEEVKNAGLERKIWQYFAGLLNTKSVGVMGDERTHQHVCAIRAVTSRDGMTADWYAMPQKVMDRISTRIVNEVKGINRVMYDYTRKPPGTIEWE